MFGNNKKFNALNGRIDGIVKATTIAFGIKTLIDITHGVVTAKNSLDINRLNRAAAGVPTDKDLQKFADIRAEWAAKAAAAAAAAPATPPTAEAPEAPATPPTAEAPEAPATPPKAEAPEAPADQNQNNQK